MGRVKALSLDYYYNYMPFSLYVYFCVKDEGAPRLIFDCFTSARSLSVFADSFTGRRQALSFFFPAFFSAGLLFTMRL